MQQVTVVDEEDVNFSVVARFDTVREAEDWVETQSKVDPAKVKRGGYGIDAPEELVNP